MLTHKAEARPKRVVTRVYRAVFRAGLIETTGLLCGGARRNADSARNNVRSAREQKAKNVASTMGLGCGW